MARLMILLIRGYQRWISRFTPATCRFHPTCSRYAIDALRTHGSGKGGLLVIWRLLRCQPLARFGVDPVPPRGRWRHPERALTRDRA